MKVLGTGGGARQQQISNNGDREKHTVCPGILIPFCCEELDYSGFEVECVGPGRVEYLEMCRDFEKPTMCCCALEQADSDPDGPPYRFPRQITCDKECHTLGLE